jgi:geranylgeranyl diphosphate synthase, type I
MKETLKLEPLLGRLKTEVDKRLAKTLAREEPRARKLGPEVSALVDAVQHLCLRGGKRLRPLFLHLGALSADSKFPLRTSAEAGVALELLQAYFLIHDDWMDEDAQRRGGPTAHVELSLALGSTHLGERAAILAGDFAVALAQTSLVRLPLKAERIVRATQAFAAMQRDAVLGQQLDVVAQSPDAEVTYQLKTASYTVQGPLEVGLALAGGGPEAQKALRRYSAPAGIAFQLRDDMLGLFGDPKTTGKPRGADLLSGKRTAFISLAEKSLSSRDRRALQSVFGKRRAGSRDVEAVLGILTICEARQLTEERIGTLEKQALRAVESKALSPVSRSLLAEATSRLIHREH